MSRLPCLWLSCPSWPTTRQQHGPTRPNTRQHAPTRVNTAPVRKRRLPPFPKSQRSPSGIALTLVDHLQAFNTAVQKLLYLPGIDPQLRLLVLNLCCRPSSSFAHLLRHLPPTATANLRLPLPPLALPPTFPTAVQLPFAHHLRRLTLDAIANCLLIRRDSISAACPTSGTTIQALLRASDGGINFPDPALLAPASFLGSVADSLPTLAADPFLRPALVDTASWPSSRSPLLRAAHGAFALLAPLLAASVTAPDASCPHQSLRARLTAPDGSLSIRLLPSVAGRRPQHSFSHAFFTFLTRQLLSPNSPLTPLARARLRHAAVPPSPMLFQMYYLPPSSALDRVATQFLYCHRLGIPLPFLPSPLPNRCHPKCLHYRHAFPPHSAALSCRTRTTSAPAVPPRAAIAATTPSPSSSATPPPPTFAPTPPW